MSSWKSYGGINNYENTNNITVDHLSANNFTLKNDYVGYFSICGELSVTNDTYLRSNVLIDGNNLISKDITINGNSFTKRNQDVRGNLGVGKNVDISGDTIMWGNLHLMRDYEIEGNLMVNGNVIQMGLVSKNPKEYNVELRSSGKKLGLNNYTPSFTFDINSDQIDGFSIKSNKTTNKNVIGQNSSGCGIVVKTDVSNNSINFFNDNSIQNGVSDGSITYSTGGNIVIKNSNNTLLNSKVSVSNRNVGNHSIHDETMVIYDISSGKYLYDIYENNVFSSGSALTLITDSSYSNTGLNIMTSSGKGIKIVGGTEITDISRSSGVIGMLDASYVLIPALSIISGNNRVQRRSSIGLNKCIPDVDDYVLDVNGPIKISHSEIVMVANTKYEIKKTVFSKTNRNNGFAFGSPVSTINGTVYSYKQVLLYSHDGGGNWNESSFSSIDSNISSKSTVLLTGCISGNNVGFVAGENSLLLFSTDAFITWNIIKYSLPIDTSVIKITNINISSGIVSGATVHTLFVFYTSANIITTNKQRIGYFTFTSLIQSYLTTTTGHTFNVYSFSFPLGGLPNILQTNASCVDSSHVLIAGNSGIGRLTKSVSLSIPTLSLLNNYNGNYNYNSMSQFGNTVIAVGGNIISVSKDKGENWTNVPTNDILNDVYVNSLTTAITVGDTGLVYSTTDSGLSWNAVDQVINNSGVGNLILNRNRKLTSINMINDRTFIISSTIKEYSISGNNIPQPAESKVFSCYFPDIFDSINNNVLDVCGNMRLSGDSSVYGNVYVSKTITTSKIKSEFIDYVGNNILIGTLSGGKTIRISDATTATSSNPNNIFIGGRNDALAIEGNNVSVIGNIGFSGDSIFNGNLRVSKNFTSNKISTEFIDYVGSNILIGTLSGGKTIRISDATTATSSNPNNIFIGGRHDNVVIEGTNVSVIGTIATQQATIQLLKNNTGGTGATGTSAGAGISIRDFNDDTSAFIHVNRNLDGFVFKSSKIRSNVLNMRVDDLSIKGRLDRINNQQIHNGIVILRDISDNNAGNVTTMTTAWFDASNVLLRDYKFSLGTPNQQTVTTDFGVSGKTVFYDNVAVNRDASIVGSLFVNSLDVFTDSKLQGKLDLTSTSELSLNVGGGGNFNGNLNLYGNLNMKNGSTIIEGNLFQKTRTFLTGNFDSYDLFSGTLQIIGGVSTKSNVFIGNNLNVTGNSTFKKIVNITNTSDATDYLTGTLIVDGGASVKKNVFILGNLEIKNGLRVKDATDVSGINIASVSLSGGCVVSKQLYCGGNIITNANLSVYDNAIIGTKNLTTIIPLSSLFTNASILPSGQDIVGTIHNGFYYISLGLSEDDDDSPMFYDVFNNNLSPSSFWVGSGYNAQGNNSSTISTMIDGITTLGNYLQIRLPSQTILTSYILESIADQPASWKMCGSNNGLNFDSLDSRTDIDTFTTPTTFNRVLSECTKAYSYYRIVVTKTKIASRSTRINKLYLNGVSIKENNTPIISIGSTSILGNLIIGGVTRIHNQTESINQLSGALIISGGIGVSGNAFINDISLKNGNVSNNLIVSKFVGIGVSSSSSSSSLDVSGSTNISGNLRVDGSIDVKGQFTLGNIILSDRTETSQLGQGAIVSFGGASIAGNLFVGGNIVSNTLTVSGNAVVKGTIHSNIRSNNIVVENGGNLTVGVGGNFICLGTFNITQSVLTSNFESHDILSGSLIIKGGAGISANVNVGGNLKVIGCTILNTFICSGNSLTNGIASYGNITDSINIDTGSLQVKGGSSIKGNIYVGGNIILSKQILVRPNISSDTIGEGSLIVVGGASISENCNIGGNTIIFGSTKNIPTIFFPPTEPPTTTTFPIVPTVTTVSTVSGNTTAFNQTSITTVSGQTYLNTYQNGTYRITTGSSAYQDYYGYYAVISGYTKPWISSRPYDNITGVPNDVISTDTFVYSSSGVLQTNTTGEWIQYSLPYILTLNSYSIKLEKSIGTTTLESYPISWIIAGSNDGSIWTLISRFINQSTTSPENVRTFNVSNLIGYSHYRFIINKVQITSLAQAGLCATGIHNISFNGIPAISPITAVPTLNPNVVVNPTTNHITYNTASSNVLNTLVGAGTFAGKSSLVVFGDSTVYGNHNVFDNLNIIGNINNPTSLLNINSNVIVNGNLKIAGVISGNLGSFDNISYSGILIGVTGSFSNINCPGTLTGATGSFRNIGCSGTLTGATGSFNNINCSGILTGATGSFNNIICSGILTGATGSFNNVNCSGILTGATGSFRNISCTDILTGATGSFRNIGCSGILIGVTGSFNNINTVAMTASGVVSGATGSFNNISCPGTITCPGALNGGSGTFVNLTCPGNLNVGSGTFNNITCLGRINVDQGSFSSLTVGAMTATGVISGTTINTTAMTASGVVSGATGSFNNISCPGTITCPGALNGGSGTFSNLTCSGNLNVGSGTFNNITCLGATNVDQGTFNSLTVGAMTATSAISGTTCSFNNINTVAMTASGVVSGATGSFNNINCSDILTGATGSFNNINCSGILTGATGSRSESVV